MIRWLLSKSAVELALLPFYGFVIIFSIQSAVFYTYCDGLFVSFSVLSTHCLAVCTALISLRCFKYWWNLTECVGRFAKENKKLMGMNEELNDSVQKFDHENKRLMGINDGLKSQVCELGYIKEQLEEWGEKTNTSLSESVSRFRRIFEWFQEMGEQYTQNVKENWNLLLIRLAYNISLGKGFNSWQLKCFKDRLPKEFLEYWDEDCEFEALDEFQEGSIDQPQIDSLRNLLVNRRFEEWSDRNKIKFPITLPSDGLEVENFELMSVSSTDEAYMSKS